MNYRVIFRESIYSTNFLKNFFIVPPDKRRKEDPQFFQKAADYWIPSLKEEIEEFENVPVGILAT